MSLVLRSVAVSLLAALLFLGTSRTTRAQTAPSLRRSTGTVPSAKEYTAGVPSSRLPASWLHVWYGQSILPGSVLGTIPEGRLGLLGVRYSRLLIPKPGSRSPRHDAPTLTYTADVLPIAGYHLPVGARPGTFDPNDNPDETALTTYGFGTYPVGLEVAFRPHRRLRPYVAGLAGFLYFLNPLPDDRGRRFNFAVGLGGGLHIGIAPRTTLTVGYRYHHLSNGFRGSINPGIDANVLYLGVGTPL